MHFSLREKDSKLVLRAKGGSRPADLAAHFSSQFCLNRREYGAGRSDRSNWGQGPFVPGPANESCLPHLPAPFPASVGHPVCARRGAALIGEEVN